MNFSAGIGASPIAGLAVVRDHQRDEAEDWDDDPDAEVNDGERGRMKRLSRERPARSRFEARLIGAVAAQAPSYVASCIGHRPRFYPGNATYRASRGHVTSPALRTARDESHRLRDDEDSEEW